MLLVFLACWPYPLNSAPATPDAPDSGGAIDLVHDSVPDAPLVEGDSCTPDISTCPDTTLCCTACCLPDAQPVCTAADPYGACPLPDVFFDEETFTSSVRTETITVTEEGCAAQEGCVLAVGSRRVVRFNTTVVNLGTADLVMGKPGEWPERFQFSECHQHYHYLDFAIYNLRDSTGSVILTGHKQAFCLADTMPWVDPLEVPTYHCLDQGLSVGWADPYGADLDCQWIDMTDVPDGDYTLEVVANPDLIFEERDYTNNTVVTPLHIDGDSFVSPR